MTTSPATPSRDLPADADLDRTLTALPSDPLAVARRWPVDRPLLMLISGRRHARWSRWTILATAPTTGDGWLRIEQDDPDPLGRLRAARVGQGAVNPASGSTDSGEAVWIGWIAYEFGRAIEPAARHDHADSRPSVDGGDWPLLELARCEAMLVHDGETGRWHARGDATEVHRVVESLAPAETARVARFEIGAPEEVVDPADWVKSVATTVELIRAGDLFQANVTRPLRVRVDGDARHAGLALLERAEPWHGALLELPGGRSIVSLSPELFLDATLRNDGPNRPAGPERRERSARDHTTGQIVTRPIKGTRPSSVDPAELHNSPKDLAELVMIVDLMRNDLGRVCEIGSVRVSEPRVIESHPTVHHGVATIEGRLRADVDLADLLAATFPPGSITGAPKIRAMQVIETLEPHARGPYCGTIGLIGDDGTVHLNVAIRTLALTPDARTPDPNTPDSSTPARHIGIYGVGCGIVADSDPDAEYRESLDKARVLGHGAVARG